MTNYLIAGAGPVGTILAARLLARGDEVRIATRSGKSVAGTRSLKVDATDATELAAAAQNCETLFLATSPAHYHRWPELWPPMFQAAVDAARHSGAKLVIVGNLYAYGEDSSTPMTERSPLLTRETKGLVRKEGWELALAAHRRGDIQAVEVRGSDYFGPRAEKTAQLGAGFFRPVMAGKKASVFGSATEKHSWTFLDDFASTLVAASDYEGEWGRPWLVPSDEPLTRTEIAARINELTGNAATVTAFGSLLLRTLGIFSPAIRAANDSAYQFNRPFVMDATETTNLLGVAATRWQDALSATVDWYRDNPA
jgi:nucleoside-diphosphate-sugar epimerase